MRVVVAVELRGLHQVAAGLDPAQGLSRAGNGVRRRLGGALWRRPWLKGVSLLAPPVGAFTVVYVAALVALFVTAFWTVDSFTGKLVHHWTTDNFSQLWQSSVYRQTAERTIAMAAIVTLADVLIAMPFAYFMARLALTACPGDSVRRSCCCRCGPASSPASTPGS